VGFLFNLQIYMNEFMPIVAQDYQTGDVRMVGV
jgi:hypothetical protein